MIINVFSFTNRGRELAEKLSRSLDARDVRLIEKKAPREKVCVEVGS